MGQRPCREPRSAGDAVIPLVVRGEAAFRGVSFRYPDTGRRVLRDVYAGRISAVVSHRLTAVMDAGRVLVVDRGRIVEQDTHAEALKQGGVCALLQRRRRLAETLATDELLAAAGDAV